MKLSEEIKDIAEHNGSIPLPNMRIIVKQVEELEAQIEKMKICGNCNLFYDGEFCKSHSKWIAVNHDDYCDKWEMKE